MSSVDTPVSDLPEFVADTTVAIWHKKPGGAVVHDGALIEIETDKVILEASTSADGILDVVLEGKGTTIMSYQAPDCLREGSSAGKETGVKSEGKASTPAQRQQASLEEQNNDVLSLAIRHLLAEYNLDTSAIKGTGVGGRLTREDVGKHLAKAPAKESAPAAAASAAQPTLAARSKERVPMIRLRKCVAEHLLEVESSTAILAAFNEVNMKPVMDLCKQYGEAFGKYHDIRLGFMSFYVKAVVEALKRCPEVNASIDGDDIVYHNYFNVSMTVSTLRGLVTLVPCDVDTLGMADIEKKIKELAIKGRGGKLTVEDLTGDNFTIINGDVFGSLTSTPIINPPRSAALGMHAIKDRSIAMDDQVEILPVMYPALFHDHRLIDGRESVGFLVTIKELPEGPARLLLDV